MVVAIALGLAACGGGGGSSTSPAPVAVATATATPAQAATTSFVAASTAVTALAANAGSSFGSTVLAASTDGTFIIQSPETPSESSVAGFAIPEYTVSGTETAGLSTSSVQRPANTAALRRLDGRPIVRLGLDVRTAADYTRTLLRSHPLRLAADGGRLAQSVRSPQTLTAGATNTFHIDQFAITGASTTCATPHAGFTCYIDKPSTLMAVSNFAYVWADNAILNDPSGLSQASFTATAQLFDTDYAIETTVFGPAFIANSPTPSFQQCNSSGALLSTAQSAPAPDLTNADPHINIVVTNALEAGGEGGYFSLANLVNQGELECASPGNVEATNGLKMIVVGSDTYNTGTSTVEDPMFWQNYDMPRSIAHEFQHYLHAINRYVYR